MRSNNSARLGRPVSESWNARWLSSWRLCRSRVAIALKESATWLSSVNESSSTRWARSPLPRRRAEPLSAASGRRIDTTSRRATSSVMSSVIAKAMTIPISCDRCSARSRAWSSRIVATTSSVSCAVAASRRPRPALRAPRSARPVSRPETSGSSDANSRSTSRSPARDPGSRCSAARSERARASAACTRDVTAASAVAGARRATSSATSTDTWRCAATATRSAAARPAACVSLSSRCWAVIPTAATISEGSSTSASPSSNQADSERGRAKSGRTQFPRPLRDGA